MADAMELLSGLLKNKDTLNNLKNLVSDQQEREKTVYSDDAKPYNSDMPDLSFLTELLSNNRQNVEIMNKMKKAYDAYSDDRDPGINLLNALTPYLSNKRNENLSKIMTAVKVGKAFTQLGR